PAGGPSVRAGARRGGRAPLARAGAGRRLSARPSGSARGSWSRRWGAARASLRNRRYRQQRWYGDAGLQAGWTWAAKRQGLATGLGYHYKPPGRGHETSALSLIRRGSRGKTALQSIIPRFNYRF